MLYRPYGSTGLQVSSLGFGGMRFADIDDVAACVKLLVRAYELGINYFDTAPGYFGGKSEERVGQAYAELGGARAKRPLYLATKSMAETPGEVRRELETSLKRLRTERVDFYHVWCVLSPEDFRTRERQGAVREFFKLQEEGLVRHVCVSSHMRGAEIAGLLREYPFAGALLGYNAANFAYREAALAGAAELGRGIAVMNPLGGGVLANFPERFGFLCTRPGESVVSGALRFLWSDPRISVALVGHDTLAHLEGTAALTENFQPLTANELAGLRAAVSEGMNSLCTGCGYCESCPQDLPIPQLMQSYDQYALHGRDERKLTQMLDWHWGILERGHNLDQCVECGQCESRCTQHLDIMARVKTARAAVERRLAAGEGEEEE